MEKGKRDSQSDEIGIQIKNAFLDNNLAIQPDIECIIDNKINPNEILQKLGKRLLLIWFWLLQLLHDNIYKFSLRKRNKTKEESRLIILGL